MAIELELPVAVFFVIIIIIINKRNRIFTVYKLGYCTTHAPSVTCGVGQNLREAILDYQRDRRRNTGWRADNSIRIVGPAVCTCMP